MFFEGKRGIFGEKAEEVRRRKRERESKQAEKKESPLSFSLSLSRSCLGRGVRHVDLSEDGVAVVGEHDAWELVFSKGTGGVEAIRRRRTTAKTRSPRECPSLTASLSPPTSIHLTSRRVKEHLEHRARSQRGADDVGDRLFLMGVMRKRERHEHRNAIGLDLDLGRG